MHDFQSTCVSKFLPYPTPPSKIPTLTPKACESHEHHRPYLCALLYSLVAFLVGPSRYFDLLEQTIEDNAMKKKKKPVQHFNPLYPIDVLHAAFVATMQLLANY